VVGSIIYLLGKEKGMKILPILSYLRPIILVCCLTCVLIAAGCTDAQPKMITGAGDIAITETNAATETIWYTMTVSVTNEGDATASDVIVGVTIQTPDATQQSRMAHESVVFGSIAPGAIRSETVTVMLDAGPVGYTDLVTNGGDPMVTTTIEQMEYLSLPL